MLAATGCRRRPNGLNACRCVQVRHGLVVFGRGSLHESEPRIPNKHRQISRMERSLLWRVRVFNQISLPFGMRRRRFSAVFVWDGHGARIPNPQWGAH